MVECFYESSIGSRETSVKLLLKKQGDNRPIVQDLKVIAANE